MNVSGCTGQPGTQTIGMPAEDFHFDLTKKQVLFERDFEDAAGNGQAQEDNLA